MRYGLNAIGRGRAWLTEEPDLSWRHAVAEWIVETLCDSDAPIESRTVLTAEGDAEATELPDLGVIVLWRLQPFMDRMDILDIEPYDADEDAEDQF